MREDLLDIEVNIGGGTQRALRDLKPEDISRKVINHRLNYLNRYNGATKVFYSVAEHSYYVFREVLYRLDEKGLSHADNLDILNYALYHDAAEAYIGDLIAPIKNCLPEFSEIEDHIMEVILKAYNINLSEDIKKEVHDIDLRMRPYEFNILVTEVEGDYDQKSLLTGDIIVEDLSNSILGIRESKVGLQLAMVYLSLFDPESVKGETSENISLMKEGCLNYFKKGKFDE